MKTAAGAVLLSTLVGFGALESLLDSGPASPWRHTCLLPVVALALRFGALAGGIAAGVAVMAQAPRWFAYVEVDGLSAPVVDALMDQMSLLALAPLVGALAGAARRGSQRYETLVAVQQLVAQAPPLPEALERLRALLVARCQATAVAIVVRDGDGLVLSGGDRLAPGSVAARVLDSGNAIFVADTGTDARPRRVLAVPLLARGDVVGVLALERVGELGASERTSLMELGASLGLALENARLAAAARRFTVELGDKVAAATRRLEGLDRAKSAFVATVSHELRTPLTALLGFSELLATRSMTTEQVRRLAGIMRTEGERLARLVDDLLDLSRIEHGIALRVQLVPVAVGPALRAAVEMFPRDAARHRIVVTDADNLSVHADPDALDRIVKNLTSNAIKYSPSGTVITLSACPQAAGVEITIADEGAGIAAEALARIFEPYYRTAEATRTASGTGLGLAVVKALVEAHGGSISVESAPGQGTRVRFSLPRAPVDTREPLVAAVS